MNELVTIDGFQGEGGGQIVRSSLALSLVTGRPIRVLNIRAKREKSGLLRQHLTAVRAAVQIGAAEVDGDEIGSQVLTFRPTGIVPGEYSFSVGTAGSATLVLQTVLPALLIAGAPSQVTVEGGTHNPWAPPYEFLAQAYFPLINRMGPRVTASLERYGFYPAGGGRVAVSVQPVEELSGLDLLERVEIVRRSVRALVANLPVSIGRREVDFVASRLGWPSELLTVDAEIESAGPGNVLLVEIDCEQVCEVFTGFGRVGVSAEHVASEVVKEVRAYLAAAVPVGVHLADQLLLPLAIAAWRGSRGGSFRTLPLTMHSQSQIDLLQRFLEVSISVERQGSYCDVKVG